MAVVRVVLVQPESPGNIGASARAIANTGLAGLDLVAPCDWRTVEAWRMAWRAEDVLEQARVFDSLEEAIADARYTAGFAGRTGMRVEPITVRDLAREIAALGSESRVSLVFGCESKGLSERQLLNCHRRVSIPSHPNQPSLNLAQAVMVAGYEILTTTVSPISPPRELEEAGKVERALRSLREAMLEIGFLPIENPEARFAEWRELFGRAGLSPREVKLVLALARRLKGAIRAARRAAGGTSKANGSAPEK
jgi:TrmH family RNA methyltransferase